MTKLLYEGTSVWVDRKGYPTVWRGGKSKKVHVLEWEKKFGPKPLGHEIHHKDENKANWSIDNLELLTHSDHQRVHAGWIKEDGEWAKKPCTKCGRVFTLDEFYSRRGLTPSPKCRPCHIEATDAWAARNPEKRKAIARAWYERKRNHA